MESFWLDCLNKFKDELPSQQFNTWIKPLKFDYSDGTPRLIAPNRFILQWVKEKFLAQIEEMTKAHFSQPLSLVLSLPDSQPENSVNTPATKIQQTPARQNSKSDQSRLNPLFTFSNFVTGKANQLARAAAIQVAENPGTAYNPLFVYGGVGLGKTHLIHAIGNKIIERSPSKKVIYLSSDAFTVEFIEAVQGDRINEFSAFYKGMDVLIIDDIQFLVGKEKTQDLFFQIFNSLHQSGKQIILSSDKPPKDLKGLNERMISRFSWGLSADIQPPDFETRIAILKNKSESYGISLSNDIFEYIAHNITSNIRELEGCLIKLLANSSLNSKEINFDLVKQTVREISTNKQVNISIDYITKVVCEFFNVEENKVREKNRRKEVVLARQVAMYLSKRLTKSSLKTIGLHFGGRDHSTVIHAHSSIEELIKEDLQLADIINSLKNKIELGVT